MTLTRRQILPSTLVVGCLLSLASPVRAGNAADSQAAAVRARVDQLLSRYAANDVEAVVRIVDPRGFVLYGSDASEIIKDVTALRQLMSDDFALWGTARFGEPTDVDIRVGSELACAMFQVPFSAGARTPVVVRFATIWRKAEGEWRLSQSANTVPTVGSSARELIRPKSKE